MACNLIFLWICIHYIEGTGAGVPVLCSYVKICDIKNTYLNIARNLRF